MPRIDHGARIRTRQVLLFFAAIGLPCIVLVALSLRMLAQERELAEKRLTDERRRAMTDVRQQLLSRLEQLQLQALTTAVAGASLSRQDRQAIALIARGDGERLVLPWEADSNASAAALMESPFAETIRAAERRELLLREYEAASDTYRRAEVEATNPIQEAFARLLRGRALRKAGRLAEAEAIDKQLAAMTPSIVDDQGIPFAFYAARRLLDADRMDPDGIQRVADTLAAALNHASSLAPVAVSMLDDLAGDLRSRIRVASVPLPNDSEIQLLRQDVERAVALQRSFSTLAGRLASPAGVSPWLAFGEGEGVWLVNASSAQPSTVTAVRASSLLASAIRQTASNANGIVIENIAVSREGESLGPNLPDLIVAFAPVDPATIAGVNSLQRSFYLAAVVLVMSMTVVGGYLFWRDVQREVRLADLRSQFVSSVSHELKTPLTAIRMFAETLLLGRSVKPEARVEYLETIVNESERLTRLLNNVLDFSKIEQGRKTYRLELQSLPTIVDAASKAMRYPLSQQGFDLRVTIDDALPPLVADADAIQQAILNLLSNAMKFSGDSRVIEMKARRTEGHAVIAVTDHGLGIAAHEQERIFEKFYRIPAPEYDRIPGTGLGLTLVDHVARAHGGKVIVESTAGEGSTFSLLLPLGAAGVAPESAAEALA